MTEDLTRFDWEPPDDPSPDRILDETMQDIQQGEFETALAKFVWFHEHALEYEPGMGGVRLSFALAYWYELAERYPPAMEKLVEIRDRTKEQCLESEFEFQAFHDLSGLNRQIGDLAMTADMFLAAHETHPEAARRIYHVAERALIAVKSYDLCNTYLEPDKTFEFALRAYELSHKLESEDDKFQDTPPFARRHFEQRVMTLIALLAINSRNEEAEEVAAKVLQVFDDPEMRASLNNAIEGHLPAEWP